jgi:hypothetical protein
MSYQSSHPRSVVVMVGVILTLTLLGSGFALLRPHKIRPGGGRLWRRGFQINQRSLAKALGTALRLPSPRQLISSSTLHPMVNNSDRNWPQEVVTGAAAPRHWHDLGGGRRTLPPKPTEEPIPLLAHSRHSDDTDVCLFLGVNRT